MTPTTTPTTDVDPWTAGLDRYQRRRPNQTLVFGCAFLCSGPLPTRQEARALANLVLDRLARPGDGEPSVERETARADRHLFEVTAPARSGEPGLRAALDDISTHPLPDTGVGLWIVHGHARGQFALVARVHHRLMDGVSGSTMVDHIAAVLAGDQTPAPDAPATAPPPPTPWHRTLRTPQATARAITALLTPAFAVPSAARLQALPPRTATTPQRHAWTRVPLERLRAATTHGRTSVNDVHLAALTGALRTWYTQRGHPLPADVVALIPVHIHRHHHTTVGNRFAATRARLPVDEPDPRRRLSLIADRMRRVRRAFAHPCVETVLRVCPRAVIAWVMLRGFRPRSFTVMVTNVPGPARRLRPLGRVVDGVVPLNFLPADHVLSVVLMTYEDAACVSFTAHPDLDGIDDLPRLWAAALHDLLTPAPPAHTRPCRPADR
ncbi:hypothetical protein B4N89_42000 [Embleya scabrispora]|uniref:diacylglycerol O-acyltransferase n=1 Tax=Embleya scabrispora TaxID=159449 RepID=A0A1T3NJW1_9ACTN|nr:WS/DGAT domain-containing protein [Embleya scabrispora]OPC77136.1 hypothetical protein B4N89_42000 [Embleya scabrispora]